MDSSHDITDAYTGTSDEEDDQEEEEVGDVSKECKDILLSTCPPRGRAFLDPRSEWVQEWNRVFLLVCATGLFIDPLFFYTLSLSDSYMCVFIDGWFAVTITVLRCVTDGLHVWNMWLQLKMSRWWQSYRHRELNHDGGVTRRVAARIITKAKKSFFLDLFVILPIPQLMELTGTIRVPALTIFQRNLYDSPVTLTGTGSLEYDLPVDAKLDYFVWLHFAEIDVSVNEKGKRVFDV